MPTPTPIPSSQIVQAVQASQNIIDNAVQQGIVGVLLLFAIAAVLFMATQLIKAYFQRNGKPESTGNLDAIKAMAEMTTRTDEREERQQEERRLERVEWRKQIEVRDEKFIEAVNHLGDGYNRMGDVLERQVALQETIVADHRVDTNTINAMKADLGQMVSVGSVPLRGLIVDVGKIPESVTSLKADIEQRLDAIDTKLAELLRDRSDCMSLTSDWNAFKSEMRSLLQHPIDAIAPASNVIDATDAGAKPASAIEEAA